MDKDQEMEFFKEKLFSNFKEAGLLEHLKGQMRYNIVEKLQKRNLAKDSNKENRNTLNQTKESSLNFRLLISLIAEFLEFYGYNYTQAVFLPEAKHTSQTLSRNEVVELLHMTKIVGKEDPTPLLNKIVDFADRQLDANKERQSVQCQTDFEGRNTNLEDKLRNVDYEYLQKIDGERLSSQQSFDEKFTKFKKDFEQRMKAEMAAEVTRIKEFELANIKVEEAEKYRLKMEQYREEIDRIYTEKLQKLRERERDTIERCKQQLKNLESASYDYRQKFLKDLEIQKIKEEGLDSHATMEKENLRMQKERLQELERDLQRQFKDLEDQKRTTLKRTEEIRTSSPIKTTSYKAEVSKEAEEDRLAVIHLKAKLENEVGKVEQFKSAAENYESQNKRLLEENSHVMEEVRRLREIKKNQEVELEKTKETLQVTKKSLEKDEGHIKLYDKQIQEYQEEIKQHKVAVQEYKEMVQQRKREQIESNQKFIKEIEFYQNEIEKAEKDREAFKQRTLELENELKSLTMNPPQMTEAAYHKDSFRVSHHQPTYDQRHEQKRESYRQNYQPEASNRYRNSVILEEDEDEPARRLDDIDKELQKLRELRENVLLGQSGDKRHTKAHSSSPRFERERHPRKHEEVQQSPQFNPYLEQSSTDLKSLERKQEEIKRELKGMIGLNDSNYSHQDSFAVGKNSEVKKAPLSKDNYFDQISDKYTDKILKDLHSFDHSYDKSPFGEKETATKGKMKYDDFAPSEKKPASKNLPELAPKKNEQYSGVKDIFRVESPQKPNVHQKQKSDPLEESQKSNKSLLDSFTEDNNPKPIVFKKEEKKKESDKFVISQKSGSKPLDPVSKKVEGKDEFPSSIGSKNLPKLDKPKLGEISSTTKSQQPLTLPTGFGIGSKKEEPKKDNKKPGSVLDTILGDQRKTTEEIDFEEIENLSDF